MSIIGDIIILKLFTDLVNNIKIEINKVEISSDNLLLKGLRIVQISDIHIHNWNRGLIEKSIFEVNMLCPDIVAITGDSICNGKKYLNDLKYFLSKLNSSLGAFACIGNHDYSDGDNSNHVIQMYKSCNIRPLVNEMEELNNIIVHGLDDLTAGKQKPLNIKSKDCLNLVLTHNPANFEEISRKNPDIVLSGHTHGGQIQLPFLGNLYKKIANTQFIKGLYNLNNSFLYVNKGLGTSLISGVFFNKKLNINTPRINASPEITLIEIV